MKGKVSPELLQKIKASVNILEIVGEHVVLRKAGANFVGLCPFHAERSPSFSVSETRQLYHCYGCKRGGDLVTFVMEILGISFPEAVEDLADRAKLALPKDWQGASPEFQEKEGVRREKQALAYKLNRFAAAFYHQNLKKSSPQKQAVRDYLLARGVGSEPIQSFYLGVAGESWDSLAQHFISKKAPLDLAVELGLIRLSTRSSGATSKEGGGASGYYDLFRARVLFPIVNLRGKIAGFGGRILTSDGMPKYLNSQESLIFQKGKLAFGLFQAQKFIREKDEVILVEGYFDVLAMHSAGFQNVVATCGTALTVDHIRLLRRFASRVVLLFDGDSAGRAATVRAMELGLDQGLIFYGARLPNGMDPDEVILEADGSGLERMSSILKEAQPLLDFEMDEILRGAHSSPEDQVQALKKIGGWLGRFRDPVGREVRIQVLQKQLGVSRALVQQALGKSEKAGSSAEVEAAIRGSAREGGRASGSAVARAVIRLSATDRILFGGLLFGGVFFLALVETRSELPSDMGLSDLFSNPFLRKLMLQLDSDPKFLEKFRLNPGSLIESDLPINIQSILTESLLWSEPPFSIEDFKGALFKCTSQLWARFSQRIKGAISEAEIRKDIELQSRLMKDYLDVQRKMKDFSNFYDQE